MQQTTITEWRIEDQPLENQVRYWRMRAESAEQDASRERRKKMPEYASELETLLAKAWDDLHYTQGGLHSAREDVRVWKEVASKAWERVDELILGGAAEVLKHERDVFERRYRNCARRLADTIEHLGPDYLGRTPGAPEP